MDKIEKALSKLDERERKIIKIILQKIKQRKAGSLDVKKLKGRDDIFRVRKGDIRIIFHRNENDDIFIPSIERRSDKKYK